VPDLAGFLRLVAFDLHSTAATVASLPAGDVASERLAA
jgi:hypothetical protein